MRFSPPSCAKRTFMTMRRLRAAQRFISARSRRPTNCASPAWTSAAWPSVAKGWLWRHESGTYVKFTDAGAELLGLAFGCIDLIVTPEGEHIFLEVNEMGQFLWVEQDEPRSELLRCFATLLLNQRLGPSTRLVGDERLSYAGFLASGAWERGYAEDGESHAKYSPPGIISEP